MQNNNLNKENLQGKQKANSSIFYMLLIMVLFITPNTISLLIDFGSLDSNTVRTTLILFLFPISFLLLTFFLHISTIIIKALKKESLTKNDILAVFLDKENPAQQPFKTIRIFVWLSFIGSILCQIVYLIYLLVLAFVR